MWSLQCTGIFLILVLVRGHGIGWTLCLSTEDQSSRCLIFMDWLTVALRYKWWTSSHSSLSTLCMLVNVHILLFPLTTSLPQSVSKPFESPLFYSPLQLCPRSALPRCPSKTTARAGAIVTVLHICTLAFDFWSVLISRQTNVFMFPAPTYQEIIITSRNNLLQCSLPYIYINAMWQPQNVKTCLTYTTFRTLHWRCS